MTIERRKQMRAVLTTGFGGLEKLQYREDVAIPDPSDEQVLIEVTACGVNNTDIWTREGAYGGSVDEDAQSGWTGDAFHFPRIQGADIVGQIVAVGTRVSNSRIGQRVIVNPTLYKGDGPESIYHAAFIGSECDGGFAEFVTVPDANALPIQSTCTDAQLATFMVSYLTAEHMLNRAHVSKGHTVLVTGASGGVGSAVLQLAKRRGARLIGVVSPEKEQQTRKVGADFVLHRGCSIHTELDRLDIAPVDVVVDVVAGSQVNELLDILRPAGTFVIAGAIAGPVTKIDWRTVYLKYLNILGSTLGTMAEARDLVRYIETGDVQPLLHKTYALEQLAQAQADFMDKKFFGKLVITP